MLASLQGGTKTRYNLKLQENYDHKTILFTSSYCNYLTVFSFIKDDGSHQTRSGLKDLCVGTHLGHIWLPDRGLELLCYLNLLSKGKENTAEDNNPEN